jgi:hypothetical protein
LVDAGNELAAMRIPNFSVSAFLNYTNATILIPN